MKALHKLDRTSVTFDDPNLVANAGLMLTGTLMNRLGLIDVIDQRVCCRSRFLTEGASGLMSLQDGWA